MDRAGELRTDAALLDRLWESAQIIEVAPGRVRGGENGLSYIPSSQAIGGERYFLGKSRDGDRPYFAWASEAANPEAVDFLTLRELAGLLGPFELEIAMHAVALSNWHNIHTHCSRCGAPTRVDIGGSVRTCDIDQSQHYPRTDSAVIVLIKDRADRILLGHQPVWPAGRFSTVAGFLEPGETFEQCVVREGFEEAGVILSELKYLGSQPWPFPASIMIAFEAITDNPDDARPDGEEITELKWFSRMQLKAAVDDGSLLLPPSVSVARRMIENWLGENVIGGETWR